MQKSSKQKTVILDSSVWIAYFRTQDAHHLRAVEVVKTYKNFIFLVPEIVLYETLIRYYALHPSIESVKVLIAFFNLNKNIIFINISKIEFQFLILNYIKLIDLKSSDFQILMFVVKFKPDIFITFDKRLKREYIKINSNPKHL